MATTVTSNGQITIEAAHRKELGIKAGDSLEMKRIGNTIIITKINPEVFEKPPGILSEDLSKKLREDSKRRYEELLR